MRHRFFRVVGVSLVSTVGLAIASSVNAAFLGLCFVFDEARTAAAQNTAAAGNDVYILYAGFSDSNDLFLNIFNVNFDVGATLYQHANGTDLAPNDTFFGLAPALEYDSFVTVGGLTTTQVGNGVGVDGNGINFTSTGITGQNFDGSPNSGSGWFTTPPTGLGVPQFNTDLGGIYSVTLAQITVAQGSGTSFTGDYTVGWNNSSSTTTNTNGSDLGGNIGGFGWVPSPGTAVALFGGLAFNSRRRRS